MDFTTPIGRLVQGDVFKGQTHNDKGEPYVIKTGPNKGQPTTKYYFGVAYPKLLANGAPNEEFNTFFRNVQDVARAGYPQFFTGPVDPFTGKPGSVHPRMTFKIMDGDGLDNNGKANNTKEGFAGHWIVKFSSSYPPRCFENGKFQPEQVITDPSRIKRGYYVAVAGSVEANIGSDVPGVYMNGNMVCLIGAGPEIVSGPDANAVFGGINTTALPAGCVVGATPASAVPAVPGAAVPPPPVPGAAVPPPPVPVAHDPIAKAIADGWTAHPGAPGHFYKGQEVKTQADVMALYPAPVAAVIPPPPAATVPPPPPAAVVPPPPVAAGVTLTAAGQALGTLDTFLNNGWTVEMLKAQGYAQ